MYAIEGGTNKKIGKVLATEGNVHKQIGKIFVVEDGIFKKLWSGEKSQYLLAYSTGAYSAFKKYDGAFETIVNGITVRWSWAFCFTRAFGLYYRADGTSLQTSADGITWTTVKTMSYAIYDLWVIKTPDGDILHMTYNTYIEDSDGSSTYAYETDYTVDGVKWYKLNSVGGNNNSPASTKGSRVYFLDAHYKTAGLRLSKMSGYNSNSVVSEISFPTSRGCTANIANGVLFSFSSNSTSNIIVNYTTNGLTYSSITLTGIKNNMVYGYDRVAYKDGVYVIRGSYAYSFSNGYTGIVIAYSTNLVDWTVVTITTSGISAYAIFVLGDKFVLECAYTGTSNNVSNAVYYTSTDGKSWAVDTSYSELAMRSRLLYEED